MSIKVCLAGAAGWAGSELARGIAGAPVGTTGVGECTPFHKGRTTMVWQTLVKSETGKLCALVTQTQLVLRAP
jgi:acyl-coenzyme A thioesterase PaaI-like protein